MFANFSRSRANRHSLTARQRPRRRTGYRPGCEHLEQRELLTVRWIGLDTPDGAGLRNWFDDGNWREVLTGGALGDFRRPGLNEELIFANDSAVNARATRNGFPPDFEFGNIRFEAPGYSVAANAALSPSNRFILNGTLTHATTGTTPVDVDIRLNATRDVDVINGTVQLRGALSGAGGLTKFQVGDLELGGGTGNSFTGAVTIITGTLLLNKTAGNAVSGTGLVIGNGSPVDTVRLLRPNQIADNAAVTINTGGVLDLNNQVETIGPLTMTAGRVEIGTGTLSVQGAITTNAPQQILESQINGSGTGTLALRPVANNQQTINVANAPLVSFDLVITARLASAVPGTGLSKIGTGRLSLRGPGTYDGLTTVGAGILNIQNNTALGATNAGTTVVSGAVLQLQGGLSVAEPVTLVGTGIFGQGALSVFDGGTNTLTGPVTFASNTNMNVTAGTTLVVSGVINDGFLTFGWTKLGGGTVHFPAGTNHLYDGATVVEDGTLQADGTITSAVTVNSGGTLTGTGTIDPAFAQALTANQGGTVSPGVAGVSGGVGTLTVDGNVTFNAQSVFQVQVSSTGGDSLRVLGANRTVNLNQTLGLFPVLSATALDAVTGGTQFAIIERVDPSGAIITGRFQGLVNSPSALTISGQAFFISYTAGGAFNDIVLQRNTAPQVEYILLYPEVITAGEYTYLVGQLTDPDPDDFQYLIIFWGDDSEYQIEYPGLEPFVYYHQYTTPGDYYVVAIWVDLASEYNFRVLPLTVLPGRAPDETGQQPGAADVVHALQAAATTPVHEVARPSLVTDVVFGEETSPVDYHFAAGDAVQVLAQRDAGRPAADDVFATDFAFLNEVFA